MAILNSPLRRRPESFLVCRSSLRDAPDLVEVLSVDRCSDAVAIAHAWTKRGITHKAEVWCGPWMVYDSDRFEHGTLLEPDQMHPAAPGLYHVEITPEDRIVYHLVQRGPGR